MKVKGGILYYSLIVIILSSGIVGVILMRSYFDNRILVDSIKQDEIERNVISAMNLYLEGEEVFKGQDSLTINLYETHSSKVLMGKRKWGNYYLISGSAGWKNKLFYKEALVGSNIFNLEPIALFMADEGRVVSLSGNTVLKGTCYLPGKTARVASIEGQQYIYKDLVFGDLKKSPTSLPQLNNNLLKFANNFLSDGASKSDSIIYISSLDSSKLENSFRNKTLFIFNDRINRLSGYSLSGNIVLWSTIPIIIDGTSNLTDVILFAPQITIKQGFIGNFQAYAIQSINVEANCKLKFPSGLCVIQSETSKYNPSDSLLVSIGQGSKVEGGICIQSYGLTSFVGIKQGAKVRGQVYCPGIVELQGEISGSLFCKSFYLGTSRASYYNHLLNTKIDFPSLSKYYSGVDLFRENPIKTVIKWLD